MFWNPFFYVSNWCYCWMLLIIYDVFTVGFGIQNSFIHSLKHSLHRCTRTLYFCFRKCECSQYNGMRKTYSWAKDQESKAKKRTLSKKGRKNASARALICIQTTKNNHNQRSKMQKQINKRYKSAKLMPWAFAIKKVFIVSVLDVFGVERFESYLFHLKLLFLYYSQFGIDRSCFHFIHFSFSLRQYSFSPFLTHSLTFPFGRAFDFGFSFLILSLRAPWHNFVFPSFRHDARYKPFRII